MPQKHIEIRGARENNLTSVSLRIPKRKITIFPGVSGFGKSTIVFDTIAKETQQLLKECFSLFIRNVLPLWMRYRWRPSRKGGANRFLDRTDQPKPRVTPGCR